MRPIEGDFAPFYKTYIDKTEESTIEELITNYADLVNEFVVSIKEEKSNYAYAENKWTVKDVLQHIIDAERVFVYRILRFSRNDKTDLSGFDEELYAKETFITNRTLANLKEEFFALRKSTDILLKSLTDTQLSRYGNANNYHVTVNALGFIIYGHLLHHINVLKERYSL